MPTRSPAPAIRTIEASPAHSYPTTPPTIEGDRPRDALSPRIPRRMPPPATCSSDDQERGCGPSRPGSALRFPLYAERGFVGSSSGGAACSRGGEGVPWGWWQQSVLPLRSAGARWSDRVGDVWKLTALHAQLPSGENIHRACDDEPENNQRDQCLHAHGQLGPMPQRHDVGRTERGRVCQAEVKVVKEQRPPAGGRERSGSCAPGTLGGGILRCGERAPLGRPHRAPSRQR